MAGQIQQVYINATRFGHQSVTLKGETAEQFGSVPFTIPRGALSAINWEAAQDIGEVQGNRIQSVGVTDGYGTATGDHEMLVSEADDWVKTVTGNGQYPLMSVFFNFLLIYSVNQGIDVRRVRIVGARIKNVSAGSQRGNDAATNRYQWRAGQVFVNGIAMYGDPAT